MKNMKPVRPWPLTDRRLRILEAVLKNGPIEVGFLPAYTGIKNDKKLKEDVGLLLADGFIVIKEDCIFLAYPGAWRKYEIQYLEQAKWLITTGIALIALAVSIVGVIL